MSTPKFTDEPRQEGRFRHLFDSIQDAVVELEIIDGEPIVRRVNPGFEDVFGYASADIRGESLNDFIVPDEYEDEAADLDSRTSDGKYNDAVLTRATANGEREFLYRGVPYEQGGSRYAFAIYSDITDQKQREAELERKNQQLDEFASILTHDLRNPINIAEGYLDQLDEPDNEECIELIEQAHDRMKEIIDDTLTLTKEAQAVEEVEAVSITKLAESGWELVETNESDLQVADEFDLVCDSDRFARLIENVFRNAIDHNEKPVTVRVGLHETMATATQTDGDQRTAFYIADDGRGIPKSQRDQVFDIGETSSREGTGLGLPIVRRIADAHGWDVQVVDGAHGGAKFIFTSVEIR
jgi:PAS domain S-box-containing protein